MSTSSDVRQIVADSLKRIKKGVEENMASHKRNATGSTVSSLRIVLGASGGYLEGSKSLQYIERGRSAGKVPRNFYDIITEWVRAKGIASGDVKEVRKIGGAIAHSIMTKGTRLKQSGRVDDIYSSLAGKEAERIANEASTLFALEIDNINNNDK